MKRLKVSLGGSILIIKTFPTHLGIANYTKDSFPAQEALCGVISLGIISLIVERNFYFPTGILHQSIFTLTPFIWLIILIFGLDNFFAWLFLNKGLQTVKAGTSSIILLTEPVLATLLGIIFYNEIPQLTSILGILIISTGILLATKEK